MTCICTMDVLQHLRSSWKTFVIVLTPICFCPLILPGSSLVSRCGFSMLVMAVYWITEALPIPVTSLLPPLLFPILSLMKSSVVATFYMKDINFLLFGGLCVAIAIEDTNLHKRFALRLLLFLGVRPSRLMLGFMLCTGILSMLISNTAATAIMLPVARAIFLRLVNLRKNIIFLRQKIASVSALVSKDEKNEKKIDIVKDGDENEAPEEPAKTEQQELIDLSALDKESKGLYKALCLCVCYSANCGGVGTLTGSPPQLVLKGQVDELDGGAGALTFTSYMVFALPVALLCLVLVWFMLQLVFFGFRRTLSCKLTGSDSDSEAINQIMRAEYNSMGPMSFSQWVVLVHFLILVLLWLTRNPGFFTGCTVLFPKGFLSDSAPALFISVSLFVFPRNRPNVLFFRRKGDTSPPVSQRAVLRWNLGSTRFPWGVMFLLGGGFALASACQTSGLSEAIAQQLTVVRSMSTPIAALIVTLIAAAATEIVANTVVATLMLPILAQIARDMAVHPIYFMLPVTIVCSCAFMLPAATPPNAVVFTAANIKITDMIRSGIVLKLVTMVIIIVGVNTWGVAYFHLNEVPDWFQVSSSSALNNTLSSLNSTLT